jgi:hypothetical protein
MILFFDGFDLSRFSDSGLLLYDDSIHYWSHATFTNPRYPDGYQGGQAVNIRNAGAITNHITADNNLPATTTGQQRLGLYLKREDPITETAPSGGTYSHVFGVGAGGHYIFVEATGISLGQFGIRLCYAQNPNRSDVVIATKTVLASTVIGVTENDSIWNENWVYAEIFVDWVAGGCSLTVDTTNNLLSYSGGFPGAPDPSDDSRIFLAAYINASGPQGWPMSYDHVWLSDGDRPTSAQRVAAVAPVASALRDDDPTGGNPQLRGFIVVNGQTYFHDWLSLSFTFGTLAPDAYPYRIWTFGENPADSSAWNADSFNLIDSWGICYRNTGGAQGARVANAALTVLEVISGFPRVTYRPPSTETFYNGEWEKSNEALSYAGVVGDIPRDAPPDDAWLTARVDGCIQWSNVSTAPPFVGVGITFAEEFDINHEDWAQITGGEDYESWFISGYKVHGEGDKQLQSNYVTVNYEPEITGSAFFQGLWDYANNPNTGRWGSKQQIIHYLEGYDHQMRKLKVRGNGRVLQFRVSSESGKPFRINGWTVFVTTAGVV